MSSLLSPRLRLFLPRVRLVRLQSSVARCPSCSRPLPANLPACTSCWSIRPLPPDTSHHELFNLEDKPNPFLVHLPTLKERFRQAQAACHPDAWATKSPVSGFLLFLFLILICPQRDRDLAHTLSSRLNEAYQTLLNPLSRAEYILERNGVHISEADQVEDLEFMGDIMEQREAIEEAGAGDSESVHRIVEENDGT